MAKVAKGMIDPDDAVLLLIDHQSGLFLLVKDMDMLTLRNNVIALAKAAKLTKTPTFTTASAPDGPNGGWHAVAKRRHAGVVVGLPLGSACLRSRESMPPRRKGARYVQARSKRSRFITLFQAATKSWTNFCWASELP